MGEEWKFGMCDCFSNFGICIMILLPIADLIVIGEMVHESGQCDSCAMAALSMFIPFFGMYKLLSAIEAVREKHGIEGSCCNDFMKVMFCGPLYLTQVRAQQTRAMGEE